MIEEPTRTLASPLARLELIALPGFPLVAPGDDLPALIVAALSAEDIRLRDGDVIVLAQKIVSKSENRYERLDSITPSRRAVELGLKADKDPRLMELVLRESRAVLRCVPGVVVVETRQGHILANAGIDRSNIEQDQDGERVLLLPRDSDGSARRLRDGLAALTGAGVGVVINDSVGRPWRNGTIGTALGVCGIPALYDRRGVSDLFGYLLRTSEIGIADEIAAAASLLMGQGDEGRPVILVRGLRLDGEGTAHDLHRPRERDLFR